MENSLSFFEQEFSKLTYSNDWNDYRKRIRTLVNTFIINDWAKGNLYMDTDSPQTMKVQCMELFNDGIKYYYIELYSAQRKVIAAQLEKCINDYMGIVLFSSEEAPKEFTAVITALIQQNKLHKQI